MRTGPPPPQGPAPGGRVRSVRVRVRGRVQGVAFRYSTLRRAERAGVVGWVRNAADGSVEAHFQGAPDAVDALLAFVGQGPRLAVVEAVESDDVPADPALSGFEIR